MHLGKPFILEIFRNAGVVFATRTPSQLVEIIPYTLPNPATVTLIALNNEGGVFFGTDLESGTRSIVAIQKAHP
jgi:hypothetical protein